MRGRGEYDSSARVRIFPLDLALVLPSRFPLLLPCCEGCCFRGRRLAAYKLARRQQRVIPTDVLLTIAEIAIAVLGFAAIVTALRRSSSDRLTWFRLRVMIEASLAALGFSFLPFVFRAAGLAECSTASFSSALFAAATVVLMPMTFLRQRRVFGHILLPGTRVFDVFAITSATLLAMALSLRSVGILPQLGFAPYVACLLFFLLVAVQGFVRIVFFASHADDHRE